MSSQDYIKKILREMLQCKQSSRNPPNSPHHFSTIDPEIVGVLGLLSLEKGCLQRAIDKVCLHGPRALNGIAPTQEALDSFLIKVLFINYRRMNRNAFDAFHFDNPNQFIPDELIKKLKEE